MAPPRHSIFGRSPWHPRLLTRRNEPVTTMLEAQRVSEITKVVLRPDSERTLDICDIYIKDAADRSTLESELRSHFNCPNIKIYPRSESCHPVRKWSHYHPMCHVKRPCLQPTDIVSIPFDLVHDGGEVIRVLNRMDREPHWEPFNEWDEKDPNANDRYRMPAADWQHDPALTQ